MALCRCLFNYVRRSNTPISRVYNFHDRLFGVAFSRRYWRGDLFATRCCYGFIKHCKPKLFLCYPLLKVSQNRYAPLSHL